MLVDGGSGRDPHGTQSPTPQLSQARPRSASTSLSLRPLHEGAATARWRSSKTRQTRIQFRHTPGEFGLTVYLRDPARPPPSGYCLTHMGVVVTRKPARALRRFITGAQKLNLKAATLPRLLGEVL